MSVCVAAVEVMIEMRGEGSAVIAWNREEVLVCMGWWWPLARGESNSQRPPTFGKGKVSNSNQIQFYHNDLPPRSLSGKIFSWLSSSVSSSSAAVDSFSGKFFSKQKAPHQLPLTRSAERFLFQGSLFQGKKLFVSCL